MLTPEKKGLTWWLATTSLRLPTTAPTQNERSGTEFVDSAFSVPVGKPESQAKSG